MWFLIIMFLILGVVAVLIRSPRMLIALGGIFSLITMFYTPWWPVVLMFVLGVAWIAYLDKRDAEKEEREAFREEFKEEVQNEVEIGDLIKRIEKRDQMESR